MIYQSTNYSFLNKTDNKPKDTAPEWMDQFFNNYLNETPSKEDLIKTASLFKIKPEKHQCNCCGNTLEENEVTFCKKCIQKSLN